MSGIESDINGTQSGAAETQRPRRMIRSIGAVLAGLVAVVILSVGTDAVMHAINVFPQVGERMTEGLFLLATAYRSVFAVAGGYITAWLAPARPMKHALVLGFIGLALSVAGLVATWNGGPELGPMVSDYARRDRAPVYMVGRQATNGAVARAPGNHPAGRVTSVRKSVENRPIRVIRGPFRTHR